jgi:hypothetical protein
MLRGVLPDPACAKDITVGHSREVGPDKKDKQASSKQSKTGSRHGAESRKAGPAIQPGTFTQVLTHAPFPYSGKYGDTEIDFFDFVDPVSGLRFHTNRYGERLSEQEHYRDGIVLFHIPPHFNPRKPFMYILFFHGILSDIQQRVKEYHLDEQVNKSGRNVILVAPQLARNAADSSPGKLIKRKAFRALMHEVAVVLAPRVGKEFRKHSEQAPIVLVAFSGGYKSVAAILDRGGVQSRIKGVVLMDALYDDLHIYEKWILNRRTKTFFVNIYTAGGSCEENSRMLAGELLRHKIGISPEWPERISSRGIYFIHSPNEHVDIPTEGPPKNPVTELLRIIRM